MASLVELGGLPAQDRVSCFVLGLGDLARQLPPEEARARLEGLVIPAYLDTADRAKLQRGKLQALALAVLLAGVCGITSQTQLQVSEMGKPEPADGSFHLGLSKADELAVLAVSPTEVGIDVEDLPKRIDRIQVLTLRRGGQAIGDDLLEHPERLTPREFSRLWTQVEAVLKAEGTGFYADPRKHPDWFAAWPCVWHELEACTICCATRQRLPLDVVPLRAEELLAHIR